MTTCYHPEKRIAFVHIPKCAGTSIGGNYHAPSRQWEGCWLDRVIPGWTREGLPNGHQPVRAFPFWTGQPTEFWDKILVPIRNPFEQQLSQYKFWRGRGKRQAAAGMGSHPDDLFAASVSFEEFVADPRSNGPNATCGDRWKASGGVYRWWLSDESGQIPPNVRIIRVEDLPHALCDALDLDPADCPDIPQVNRTEPTELADWYTPAAERSVRAKFGWSLATHYKGLTAPVAGTSMSGVTTRCA